MSTEDENFTKASLAVSEAKEALKKAEKEFELAKQLHIKNLAEKRFAILYPNGSEIPKFEASLNKSKNVYDESESKVHEIEQEYKKISQSLRQPGNQDSDHIKTLLAEKAKELEQLRRQRDFNYDQMKLAKNALHRQRFNESPEGLE